MRYACAGASQHKGFRDSATRRFMRRDADAETDAKELVSELRVQFCASNCCSRSQDLLESGPPHRVSLKFAACTF
jgi:hypothetical protein